MNYALYLSQISQIYTDSLTMNYLNFHLKDGVFAKDARMYDVASKHVKHVIFLTLDTEIVDSMIGDNYLTIGWLTKEVDYYEHILVVLLAHESKLIVGKMLVDIHKVEEVAIRECLLLIDEIEHVPVYRL